MKRASIYDWDYFISKAPFKKILTDVCGLSISKKVKKTYIIFDCYQTSNHYMVRINFKSFQDNFETIKNRLLNTRICKHNKDVFDFVRELECTKKDLCSLVMDGCIKEVSGSFEWDWCDK